jgi:hypothetical protein
MPSISTSVFLGALGRRLRAVSPEALRLLEEALKLRERRTALRRD